MRRFSIEHLVEDNSHRPDITLSGVSATVKDLRTHIHRTADQRLMNFSLFCTFLVILSEPKISDFIGLVFDQYVSRFEISMDY